MEWTARCTLWRGCSLRAACTNACSKPCGIVRVPTIQNTHTHTHTIYTPYTPTHACTHTHTHTHTPYTHPSIIDLKRMPGNTNDANIQGCCLFWEDPRALVGLGTEAGQPRTALCTHPAYSITHSPPGPRCTPGSCAKTGAITSFRVNGPSGLSATMCTIREFDSQALMPQP